LTRADLEQAAHNAIVTEQLANQLTNNKDLPSLVNKKITLGDEVFTIVGVARSSRARQPELFFPITTRTQKELMASPPQCVFEASEVIHVQPLKAEILKWINHRYGKADDFSVQTNELRVEQAAQGFKLFRIIMGLIVGISVVVGGIGVMNVLLISVTERTVEIVIRKAVGANRKDIILQFLSESITISLFGSLLGLVIGVLGTMITIPIIKALTEIPFQAAYTLNTLMVVSILAVVVGVVFGTYPAIRASRLDPVEAIRRE
jgi:putative ABC transport system permease protein